MEQDEKKQFFRLLARVAINVARWVFNRKRAEK